VDAIRGDYWGVLGAAFVIVDEFRYPLTLARAAGLLTPITRDRNAVV
jgi:hypothetical protein